MRETGKGGVQDRCVKHARSHGWYARKLKSPANNALPDFLFAKSRFTRNGFTQYKKCVLFVEFKAPGKKPSPLQMEEHAEMLAAGLTLCVIDNVEDFVWLLEYYGL